MWNLKHNKRTYLRNKDKLTDIKNRLVGGGVMGEGWIGSLGVTDASSYI